jgi:hypothetical protein
MKRRNIVLWTILATSGFAAGGCAGGCEPVLFEDELRSDIYGRVALTARAKPALGDNDQVNVAVGGLAVLALTAREDVTLPEMILDAPENLGASFDNGAVTLRPTVEAEGQIRLLESDTEFVVVSVHVRAAQAQDILLYPNASPLGPALRAGPSFAVLDGTEMPLIAELRDAEQTLLIDESLVWSLDGTTQEPARWDTWRLPSMPGAEARVTVTQGATPRTFEVRSVDRVEALRAFATYAHEWKALVLSTIEADAEAERDLMSAALDNLEIDPATRTDFRGLLEARWYCYQARTNDTSVFGVDWSFQTSDKLRILGKAGPCVLLHTGEGGELSVAADGQEIAVGIESE